MKKIELEARFEMQLNHGCTNPEEATKVDLKLDFIDLNYASIEYYGTTSLGKEKNYNEESYFSSHYGNAFTFIGRDKKTIGKLRNVAETEKFYDLINGKYVLKNV